MTTPFNLEAAKNGAAVQTRGGKPARIVCFDAVGPQPLVVLLKQDDEDMLTYGHEEAWQYTAEGWFNRRPDEGQFGNLDLVMA